LTSSGQAIAACRNFNINHQEQGLLRLAPLCQDARILKIQLRPMIAVVSASGSLSLRGFGHPHHLTIC
jgi:hypothetical protein